MKQYNYFVAFSYSGGGIGSAYIERTSKLDAFDKLTELAKWIGSTSSIENVVILNYRLVSVSRAKKEKKGNGKKSD